MAQAPDQRPYRTGGTYAGAYNTALAPNATLDANNAALIADFKSSCLGGGIYASADSAPVFVAQSGDPVWTVTATLSGGGGTTTVRAPAAVGALSAAALTSTWGPDNSDKPLELFDNVTSPGTYKEVRCWRVSGVDASAHTITCSSLGVTSYGPTSDGYPFSQGYGTGSGLALAAGLLRFADFQNGSIDHAIRVSGPRYISGGFRPPATKSDQGGLGGRDPANPGGYGINGFLQMGVRFRLKASVDPNSRTCPNPNGASAGIQANRNAWVRMVCQALQTYGMIVADGTAADGYYFQMELDTVYNGTANWGSVFGTNPLANPYWAWMLRSASSGGDGFSAIRVATDGIPWDQFEVVADGAPPLPPALSGKGFVGGFDRNLSRVAFARPSSMQVSRSAGPFHNAQSLTLNASSSVSALLTSVKKSQTNRIMSINQVLSASLARVKNAQPPQIYPKSLNISVSFTPSVGRSVIPQSSASWYVAANGNDNNSGTSAGSPFRTFNKAYLSASSGQKVSVAAGNYSSQSIPAPNNNVTTPVIFQGGPGVVLGGLALGGQQARPPGDQPIPKNIEFRDMQVNGELSANTGYNITWRRVNVKCVNPIDGGAVVYVEKCDNSSFIDCEFDGQHLCTDVIDVYRNYYFDRPVSQGGYNGPPTIDATTQNLTFQGCTIHGNTFFNHADHPDGLQFTTVDKWNEFPQMLGLKVIGCYFYDCNTTGLRGNIGIYGAIIENNVFDAPVDTGAGGWYPAHMNIQNSDIRYNSWNGEIQHRDSGFSGSQYVPNRYTANVCQGSSGTGCGSPTDSNSVWRYNVQTEQKCSATDKQVSDLKVGNYPMKPLAGSPVINAGDPTYFPATDIGGNLRTGTPWAGAWQILGP